VEQRVSAKKEATAEREREIPKRNAPLNLHPSTLRWVSEFVHVRLLLRVKVNKGGAHAHLPARTIRNGR
jgi:hypothetical protein